MILGGVDFGLAWNGSGARGFFGERNCYWFHPLLRPFGLDWSHSTFVAKTCTYQPWAGNMPLLGARPRDWWPECVRVAPVRKLVLNAVGLSNPGLEALLRDGRWQKMTDPFLLSMGVVGANREARKFEVWGFSEILSGLQGVRSFKAPVAIQINLSCPNVGHDPTSLIEEAVVWIDILADRLPGVPLLPKISPLVSIEDALTIASHPACSAMVVGNSIPWRTLEEREAIGVLGFSEACVLESARAAFGRVSPLADLVGGGISGRPLLPIVVNWVATATWRNFPVPIVAGGGILSSTHAGLLLGAGASAVELGCVALLRPWRIRGILRDLDRDRGSMENRRVKH